MLNPRLCSLPNEDFEANQTFPYTQHLDGKITLGLCRPTASARPDVQVGHFVDFGTLNDRDALLPKWTALGANTKFDATCKMVRSDWPQILGGSPGQSPGGRNGSPFMQSGGGSPRRAPAVR